MSLNKQAVGFYATALSAVLALVSVIAYFVNCGTAYFGNLGVDPAIAGCAIVAIVIQVALIVLAQQNWAQWMDAIPVAASVLLIIATMLLLASRIGGIAGIMTFEGNAQTRADMSSAIVAIATGLIAAIVSTVSAFFDITKN